MDWTPGGVSDDIEDRRGESGGGNFGGFGPHIGIGGFLVLLVLSGIFHQNFFALFSGPGGSPSASSEPGPRARDIPADANDKQVQFLSFVLDDVQHTWETLLPAQTSTPYRHAKLVLFRDETRSACGAAESATGPFC